MTEDIWHIINGSIDNRAQASKTIGQLPDGKYKVKFEPFKKRSQYQNRYYWGVVVPLVQQGLYEMGYDDVKTPSDAHEIMKHIFLRREYVNPKNDDRIVVAGSTTKLSTVGFMEFIDEIIRWGSTYLGITNTGAQRAVNNRLRRRLNLFYVKHGRRSPNAQSTRQVEKTISWYRDCNIGFPFQRTRDNKLYFQWQPAGYDQSITRNSRAVKG